MQKPGRYTGGEPGCVYKDKSRVDMRMAFCFPDTYEIGMSFLGEKILYDILNRHETGGVSARSCLERYEGSDGAAGHSALLP